MATKRLNKAEPGDWTVRCGEQAITRRLGEIRDWETQHRQPLERGAAATLLLAEREGARMGRLYRARAQEEVHALGHRVILALLEENPPAQRDRDVPEQRAEVIALRARRAALGAARVHARAGQLPAVARHRRQRERAASH